MAYGFKVNGIDISELYESDDGGSFSNEVKTFPEYKVGGSDLSLVPYSSVYHGGWEPPYLVTPSNYNIKGNDAFIKNNIAPKNTCIAVEWDNTNKIARPKIELPYDAKNVSSAQKQTRYTLTFTDAGSNKGNLRINKYTSKGWTSVYNETISKKYIIIRMCAPGQRGNLLTSLDSYNKDAKSGYAGATAFGILRARSDSQNFVLAVSGADKSLGTPAYTGILLEGQDTDWPLVACEFGTISTGSITNKNEYIRPIYTGETYHSADEQLPSNSNDWPMTWGADGAIGGDKDAPAEDLYRNFEYCFCQGKHVYKAENQYTHAPYCYRVTVNNNHYYFPEGGSSLCGHGSGPTGARDMLDSFYNVYKEAIDKGTGETYEYAMDLARTCMPGIGGGGGCLYSDSNMYRFLSAANKKDSKVSIDRYLSGGDGQIALFW